VIVLGIESATELVGVAVADDVGPRAALWATGRRRHAEALAPAIAQVLEQAEVELGDLGAVAVDLGPGLFTGLRVGVATAKGLGQGLGLGVVGLTSLAVLARAAADAGVLGPLAAVVDARRGEVFCARYLLEADPRGAGAAPVVREVAGPRVLAPGALADQLAGWSDAPVGAGPGVLAVGDGARRYAPELLAVPGLRVAGPSLAAPPPATVAAMAWAHLGAGGTANAPAEVRPLYLREADVRINWAARDPAPPPG
jgi:tRNA threonylcarbamoyladenosine biosynthesis protein TsaB